MRGKDKEWQKDVQRSFGELGWRLYKLEMAAEQRASKEYAEELDKDIRASRRAKLEAAKFTPAQIKRIEEALDAIVYKGA